MNHQRDIKCISEISTYPGGTRLPSKLSHTSLLIKLALSASLVITGISQALATTVQTTTIWDQAIPDITDGLIINVSLQVKPGAGTVNITSLNGDAITLNNGLWLNGGDIETLGGAVTTNGGFIQLGGTNFGGVTNAQTTGLGGKLDIGNLVANGSNFEIEELDPTSSFSAKSINIKSDSYTHFQSSGQFNVAGDYVINSLNRGRLIVSNKDSNFFSGGNLSANLSSFQISGSSFHVNGNVILRLMAAITGINDVNVNCLIAGADFFTGGNFTLLGSLAGNTSLQTMNGDSSHQIQITGDVNLDSSDAQNNMTTVLGHGTILKVGGDINVNSISGGNNKLYIGDSKYGAPNSITAKSVNMAGNGDNEIIFNNNKSTDIPSTPGYLFSVPIKGYGSVVQQSGHSTLTSDENTYTQGTKITGGLLSITDDKALGTGGVDITTDGSDAGMNQGLDINYAGYFTHLLTGTGWTTVSGDSTIESDNHAYAGNWNVAGTARVDKSATNTSGFGLGRINIALGGFFDAVTDGAFTFSNKLTGLGTLIADNKFNEFNFSTAVGDRFRGTVLVENNVFNLDGVNTRALTNAELRIGAGNVSKVGLGTQHIGALSFDGGTLVFGDLSPGLQHNDKSIETLNNLDLTGTGKIQVSNSDDVINMLHGSTVPPNSLPLLQQDDTGVLLALATSLGTVNGDGGNLLLVDKNGVALSHSLVSDITQDGQTVARGTYDYRLTSNHGNGLYINYGLSLVDLLAHGTHALALSANGKTGSDADLSARLTGAGDLIIDTDTELSLSNSGNDYTGLTDVLSGPLKMGNSSVLGKTQLLHLGVNGKLDMNGFTQSLQNIATDTGSLFDFNKGHLSVNNGAIMGDMTGAGQFDVAGGTVTLSGSNAGMSADTTIATDGIVRMLSGQALGSGHIINQGIMYLGQDGDAPAPYSTGAVTNFGTIVIGHNDVSGNPVAGSTLTVNGNYAGNNGHLLFNTVLGNDKSVTDKMVVTGDTSGSTNVSVANAGGKGDVALNGINLIQVDGKSDGNFVQDGRIVAGAYDYSLVRGKGSNKGNWYLTSEVPVTENHVFRPEAGSYTANMAAANTVFNTRLHDRLGETQYIDALTGEKKVTSLWLRQTGEHNRWHDDSGQLSTQSNSYVVQLGGDVAQWSRNGLDRGHLGMMAGYANSHSSTDASLSGYRSKGSVNGYSTGVYGTWYANDTNKNGLYLDGWLQYSWFSNQVNGEKLAAESYKSRGLTASAETGYTLKLGTVSGKLDWYIQPQAQATWMGVKSGNHHESNGTSVKSQGEGNVQTRLGIRTYLKGHSTLDKDNGREFEPFIETNWIHNTNQFGTVMDGERTSQNGSNNIVEVKLGVEGKINSRVNLWGNIGSQLGQKGYSNNTAMIGVKYNF